MSHIPPHLLTVLKNWLEGADLCQNFKNEIMVMNPLYAENLFLYNAAEEKALFVQQFMQKPHIVNYGLINWVEMISNCNYASLSK